jgi:hypothetical protein
MGHRDIKSTMVYLKGVLSKDALARVNAGALARYAEIGFIASEANNAKRQRPGQKPCARSAAGSD